jgi:hypothetical protein
MSGNPKERSSQDSNEELIDYVEEENSESMQMETQEGQGGIPSQQMANVAITGSRGIRSHLEASPQSLGTIFPEVGRAEPEEGMTQGASESAIVVTLLHSTLDVALRSVTAFLKNYPGRPVPSELLRSVEEARNALAALGGLDVPDMALSGPNVQRDLVSPMVVGQPVVQHVPRRTQVLMDPLGRDVGRMAPSHESTPTHSLSGTGSTDPEAQSVPRFRRTGGIAKVDRMGRGQKASTPVLGKGLLYPSEWGIKEIQAGAERVEAVLRGQFRILSRRWGGPTIDSLQREYEYIGRWLVRDPALLDTLRLAEAVIGSSGQVVCNPMGSGSIGPGLDRFGTIQVLLPQSREVAEELLRAQADVQMHEESYSDWVMSNTAVSQQWFVAIPEKLDFSQYWATTLAQREQWESRRGIFKSLVGLIVYRWYTCQDLKGHFAQAMQMQEHAVIHEVGNCPVDVVICDLKYLYNAPEAGPAFPRGIRPCAGCCRYGNMTWDVCRACTELAIGTFCSDCPEGAYSYLPARECRDCGRKLLLKRCIVCQVAIFLNSGQHQNLITGRHPPSTRLCHLMSPEVDNGIFPDLTDTVSDAGLVGERLPVLGEPIPAELRHIWTCSIRTKVVRIIRRVMGTDYPAYFRYQTEADHPKNGGMAYVGLRVKPDRETENVVGTYTVSTIQELDTMLNAFRQVKRAAREVSQRIWEETDPDYHQVAVEAKRRKSQRWKQR